MISLRAMRRGCLPVHEASTGRGGTPANFSARFAQNQLPANGDAASGVHQHLRNNTMTNEQTQTTSISIRFILGCIAFAVLGTFLFMAAGTVMSGGARISYDATPWFLAIHVGTVIPALFLGAPVLMMKKGTRLHKLLGRIWASLMMITAISSFGLNGITGGLSPIHIFSVVTVVSIPWAVYNARIGNIAVHQRAMTGPYIGLLIAGLFSFMPGRLMGELAFAAF
jgi:uncharacterized membrane protein